MSDFKEKKAILNDYLNKMVGNAPIQRSKEWYAIKQTTIGGSEVSTILGCNPFRKVKDMIAEKIGLSFFNGSPPTRWGNLFENITKKWGEIVLKMEEQIHESGSIEGIIARQRYSPDGLGIVKLKCSDGTFEYYMVLFEFKAPSGTFPNGKIPKHYIPQLQTGLLNIHIADISIFINNAYRKCALEDFNFNSTYDSEYHAGDYKKRKAGLEKETVLGCGIIAFYQTMEDYYKLYDYLGYASDSDSDSVNLNVFEMVNGNADGDDYYKDGDTELLLDSKDNPIDLGLLEKNKFNRILELYDSKRLHVIYYPIIVNNEAVNNLDFIETHDLQRTDSTNIDPENVHKLGKLYVNRFSDKCEKNNLCSVGFLPWKLMISDIIIESRDEKWQSQIEEPIKNTIKILDEILNSADPHKKFGEIYSSLEESDAYLEEMNSGLPVVSIDTDVNIDGLD